MDYKYRIAIKTWQQFQYGGGWYQDLCEKDITFPDNENVKQFIERYGSTLDTFLFLDELLNLCSPKPSQEQTANLASLDYETLKRRAEQLWEDLESLQIAKQELDLPYLELKRIEK